ncbi:hypothetical protein MNBD_GAMMA15-2479 [hydrothermal vent metagenome]|uniref:OmpA-like domain-containing protein n=1 Tax=hydrothermal vent metagenome TaxID=652676 RepID=A0A3B0Y844_9ZZZZ
MKQVTRIFMVVGFGLTSSLVFAGEGYVSSISNSVVRTGFGECLHTARWSEQVAVVQCEPEIVAARDAVKLAAIEVVMVKELKPIRLETDALFAFDSAALTEGGKTRLNAVLGSLTAADLKDEKIRITGHTDVIGDDGYNLKLSQQRALVVRDHLVSQGVVPGFIETSGVGESQPLVNCDGKHGAALVSCLAPNRRTEVELSAMELVEVERKPSD